MASLEAALRSAVILVLVFALGLSAFFQLVKIQHCVGSAVQVALESLQRNPDDVAMMNSLPARDLRHLKPYLVNQVHVFLGQIGRMRSKQYTRLGAPGT